MRMFEKEDLIGVLRFLSVFFSVFRSCSVCSMVKKTFTTEDADKDTEERFSNSPTLFVYDLRNQLFHFRNVCGIRSLKYPTQMAVAVN